MPNRYNVEIRGVRRGVRLLQHFSSGVGVGGSVPVYVDRLVEYPRKPRPAHAFLRKSEHKGVQNVHVLFQLPDGFIEKRESRGFQYALMFSVYFRIAWFRITMTGDAEEMVGRGFRQQRESLFSGRFRRQSVDLF
jgi:hypothetical protein